MRNILLVIGLGFIIFIGYIFNNVHKDDAKLRSECEARGGVFVEARQPIHICVTPR